MKFLREKASYFANSYSSSFATSVALSTFLFMVGPISTFSQNSSILPSNLNQTSTPFTGSSERLGPPLIVSGQPERDTSQGPGQQQQQYTLYEDPQNGFSIEYPSDWTVRPGGGRPGVIATFSSPFETNFDPFAANFVIGVENLTSAATLDNYTGSVVALLQSQPPGADFNLTGSPVSTTFGGLPAQRIGFTLTALNERSLSSEVSVEGIQVWTVDNDTAYVLSFAGEQTRISSYLPVIEHIIETFRITRTAG